MFQNVVRNLRSWRKYNVTRNELMRLSEHELADLGISRTEIDRVARQVSL